LILTLDYYVIAVEDRLGVSSSFDVGPAEVAQLQALGVPNANTIGRVRYFTNGFDTDTSGIDLVATYSIDWGSGNTTVSLAGNYNKTEVTGRKNQQTDPTDPTPVYLLNDTDMYCFRRCPVMYRANLTGRHSWANGITASLRGNWYGDYKRVNRDMSMIQNLADKTFWDAEITWDVNEEFSVTLGGNNIFDEYPDRPAFGICCGILEDTGSVMDWQGSYYFVRGVLRWN